MQRAKTLIGAAAASLLLLTSCSYPEPPEEAGRSLSPNEVDWMSHAPQRTLVNPVALREAFRLLEAQIESVIFASPTELPQPSTTRVQIPAGWGESNDVSVLIGAQQRVEFSVSVDRCAFLRQINRELAELGWTTRADTNDAIQTTYPLVIPAPQDWTLTAKSGVGVLSIRAPVTGNYWINYAVEQKHLSGSSVDVTSTPVTPHRISCKTD